MRQIQTSKEGMISLLFMLQITIILEFFLSLINHLLIINIQVKQIK
jgi:hypothetical protein